jgi:hypothetical protein
MQHTLHLSTHLNHLIHSEIEPKWSGGGGSALLYITIWSGVKMVIDTGNNMEWSREPASKHLVLIKFIVPLYLGMTPKTQTV